MTTTLNTSGTWWGWARVPIVSPRAAPTTVAKGVTVNALPDLREDVREDEDEQQRLHDRPGGEDAQVLPQHLEVAAELRHERLRRRPADGTEVGERLSLAGRRFGGDGHSRSSLPVSRMKTVSSVGSVRDRSVTLKPPSSAQSMIL